MATVVLARHGRTSANTGGVLAGRSRGIHLDEVGVGQAAEVGQRLAGLGLAAVVTSPMERCRETAAAISKAHPSQPRVVTDRQLTEVDYGDWTGRPLRTLAKEPLWRAVQAHPASVVFPGGESMAAMSARAVAAVRRWDARVTADHGPHAVWVAVSHGDVIKAVVADALGMHLDAFQRIVVGPASLSVISYTELRPFVVALNSTAGDMGYLKPPARKRRARRLASDAVVGGGDGAASG